MMNSARPVLLLLLLAPLVAEYLLGDLTLGQLKLLPFMLPIYGGGALLIREAARRSRRGWPAILILGLAYGIIEEALATQSLFNPHYLGLRLIDYGYIPALGISGPWTVYVLAIHAVWSIAVPIALAEALFPERRRTPWLGNAGLAASAVLYAAGVALVFVGTRSQEHFMASGTQLLAGALLAAAVAASAFVLARPRATPGTAPAPAGPALRPWIPGLIAFLGGMALHSLARSDKALSPAALTAAYLAVAALTLAAIARARRAPGWTDDCADGAAVGAVLVYCWWGFLVSRALHGSSSLPGHSFFVAGALALLALIRFRRPAARAA